MTDLERFEIRAETFRRMTGYMAPGKDAPAAMNPSDDYMRERVEEWERWNVAYGTVVAHVLAAADSVLPGGPSA